MKISRENYEIWFIDYFDGKLDNEQVKELMYFLTVNTDLKEEFEDFSDVKLTPAPKVFSRKGDLLKSVKEITDSQFEFLCAGSLENDLSEEQCRELEEIVESDPLKMKEFEIFRKTKLTPLKIQYKNKHILLKHTLGQSIFRIGITGLSAAALVAMAIIILKPKNPYLDKEIISRADVNHLVKTELTSIPKLLSERNAREIIAKSSGSYINNDLSVQKFAGNDSSKLPSRALVAISKLTVSGEISISGYEIPSSLVAGNIAVITPELNDDDRPRFSKFIARTIREKILKEKTPKDTPLRGYEVARAGITGLNVLFGWEMALNEIKDENGNPKSLNFNSRILKFNTPLNKSAQTK